jgi:hypothetical protein
MPPALSPLQEPAVPFDGFNRGIAGKTQCAAFMAASRSGRTMLARSLNIADILPLPPSSGVYTMGTLRSPVRYGDIR